MAITSPSNGCNDLYPLEFVVQLLNRTRDDPLDEVLLKMNLCFTERGICLGIKDGFGLEKCRSKAAYLRGGRFSKLVSPGRANFQLRNDFYKGIVHR